MRTEIGVASKERMKVAVDNDKKESPAYKSASMDNKKEKVFLWEASLAAVIGCCDSNGHLLSN